MSNHPVVEHLLRELAPQVLGAVVRRYGHFDAAEDATQEALMAAAAQWPTDGIPVNPRGWLITVAARRLTDLLRSEQARRRREDTASTWTLTEDRVAPPADRHLIGEQPGSSDDTLILLFLCCHPSLSPAAQIALTLRAVAGLSTAEIARAFLVPEPTMTRRITRAKERIRQSGVPFRMPLPAERQARLDAVLHVIYLIFTEGYTGGAAPKSSRPELCGEAIRLAEMVRLLLPRDGEVAGLVALLLLTDARRPARTAADGSPIPMAEQDRTLWNAAAIERGVALITRALPRGTTGPYQLQAAIAAIHDEAPSAERTDWAQIVALYELLLQIDDNPIVRLNHAVAVSRARGPAEALELLDAIGSDARLANDHRLPAVRADLLERLGEVQGARQSYRAAARLSTSPERQRYLYTRAERVTGTTATADGKQTEQSRTAVNNSEK